MSRGTHTLLPGARTKARRPHFLRSIGYTYAWVGYGRTRGTEHAMTTIDATLQSIRERLDRLSNKALDLPDGYKPPTWTPSLPPLPPPPSSSTVGGGAAGRPPSRRGRRGGGLQDAAADAYGDGADSATDAQRRQELADLHRHVKLQLHWVQEVADEMRDLRERGEDMASIRPWHQDALENLRKLQARVRELEARARVSPEDKLNQLRTALDDMDFVLHEVDHPSSTSPSPSPSVQDGGGRARRRGAATRRPSAASTTGKGPTVVRDGKTYRVHVGPRGGRHIVVRGARVYLAAPA